LLDAGKMRRSRKKKKKSRKEFLETAAELS
jgi:hypothetical protein